MNTQTSASSGQWDEFSAQYRATLARLEQQLGALSVAFEDCSRQLKTNNELLRNLTSRCAAIAVQLDSLPSPEELAELKRIREAAVRNTAVMEQYISELEILRSEYSWLRREYDELKSVLQRR